MRRCLAILRSSCGGAAGCLTLRISRRWKNSLHNRVWFQRSVPAGGLRARKTNNCWHPNKKKTTQTRTCWNSNSAVWSIKKNKKKQSILHSGKSFLPSVLRRLHPCQVQMMKTFPGCQSRRWVASALIVRKTDSLEAKPTENMKHKQTLMWHQRPENSDRLHWIPCVEFRFHRGGGGGHFS